MLIRLLRKNLNPRRVAGFDFGLKSFLTCSEGFEIHSPQFLKRSLQKIRKANKQLSRKQKGSRNREKARKHLARCHEKVANQRRDWFWKLAHQLTDQFDTLYFETLNLKGMIRLWGRKVADLALREFLNFLEWVALKKGKQVVLRDQWFPSSKTCSHCGYVLESLELEVREWECSSCHPHHDRDLNAAKNLKTGGIPSVGLGSVRWAYPATSV